MCLLLFLFFQFSFFHVSGILISVVWDLRLNFLPRVPSWTKVEPHRSQWLCKVFGVVHSSMAARIGQISNAVVWCLSNGLNQPLAKKCELLQNDRIFILLFTTEWFEINIQAIAYYLWKKECKMHTCTEKMFLIHLLIHIYKYI